MELKIAQFRRTRKCDKKKLYKKKLKIKRKQRKRNFYSNQYYFQLKFYYWSPSKK